MLEMLHLDVSKVDLGVAHVAVATYAYCMCFIRFQIYVANVSSGCFKSKLGIACHRPPAPAGAPP
jgi:hypothetical protein